MPALQEEIGQSDFSYGMVRDVSPALIPEDGLYDALNALFDKEGSPFKRGRTSTITNAAFGSAGLRWVWDGYFTAGRRTVCANDSDFGVVGADEATMVNIGGDGAALPPSYAFASGYLFIGEPALSSGNAYIYGGSRKTANYSTGTASFTNGSKTVTGAGTAWLANLDAGMLIQRGSERVYAIASIESDTSLTLRDAYVGVTGAGVAYTARPLYTITSADPYEISSYYAVVANRLIWGEGNKLRFGTVDDPHTAWNTDNEHELMDGAEIIGIGGMGNLALVFSTNGVEVTEGLAYDIVDAAGNPQHRRQTLSKDIVLWGQAGFAAFEQSFVVPAIDGIYVMDGVASPRKISHPIDHYYTEFTRETNRSPGQAVVMENHYLLPILDTGDGSVVETLVCRLDQALSERGGGWSRFDGDGGNITAFAKRIKSGARNPQLLGAQRTAGTWSRIVDCSDFFDAATGKNDADGTTPVCEVITKDYETGSRTKNVVRALFGRYELIDAATDNPNVETYYAGEARVSGDSLFDSAIFGTDTFDTEGSAEGFISLCTWPESDGSSKAKCRVNHRTRYVRFKIRNSTPCRSFILRDLSWTIRPSRAGRR